MVQNKLDRDEEEIISFDVRICGTDVASKGITHPSFRKRSAGFNFHSEMAALATYMHRSNVVDRDAPVGAAVLKHLLNAAESLALSLQDRVETKEEYELLSEIEDTLDGLDRTGLDILACDGIDEACPSEQDRK